MILIIATYNIICCRQVRSRGSGCCGHSAARQQPRKPNAAATSRRRGHNLSLACNRCVARSPPTGVMHALPNMCCARPPPTGVMHALLNMCCAHSPPTGVVYTLPQQVFCKLSPNRCCASSHPTSAVHALPQQVLCTLSTNRYCARSPPTGKEKVFYGQEPPSEESTTTEYGVNYKLLAVMY